MTVYISSLEDALLHWLIPILVLFIFLSILAAAMVFLAAANVRIDVQIKRADASSRSPHHEGGRD